MENIQGYEIEKSVLFENNRGFALGHNPAAPQPYAAQAAARAKANSDFLAKQAAEKAMEKAAERAALETEELINKCKVVGKAGLVIGGVIIIGYGIYKVTPKVKSWWYERKLTSKNEDTIG